MADDTHATGSTLDHLEGSQSGRSYSSEELFRCDPLDGKPLLPRYDLERAASVLTKEQLAASKGAGMWRWAPILPVRDSRYIASLGEGSTPLLRMPRLGQALGVPNLWVKSEGQNPTGSFKARGMSAAVSRANELGVKAFIAPSAGNAAGALAAYGAVVGADVTVLMPVDVPEANRAEVLACGGRLILVDGLISDCGRVGAAIAEMTGAFDVSTLKEPYRVEGKKTMGLELAEALGWRLPDVVVYPTGGGTGLVGMWKAFAELEEMGLIGSERPRMISVQAAGCAPIVRAFDRGERFAEPWQDARTRAGGLRVPSAIGDFLILDAIRESGGTAVAVEEDAITRMQVVAGSNGAGYVSPETAAALAALPLLRDDDLLSSSDEVVVFDTGIGHKYPPPPDLAEPAVVDPSHVDVERLHQLVT